MEKLMPPLVAELRRKVKDFRDSGYTGASPTPVGACSTGGSRSRICCRGQTSSMENFEYYFAQREAIETIVYLYDVVGAKDKYDLMRFDSSGSGVGRYVR